jgi:GAF domain-containing protein
VVSAVRSELMEPYSREDKQLLAAVASQAGVALETIRLGENIAERIEAERRAAQEMEFARRLLQALRRYARLPVEQMLEAVGKEVREFNGGQPQDDLTLVMARCLA